MADTEKYISSLKELHHWRILFVCLGNICRSPAAEGLFRAIVKAEDMSGSFEIDSAGTGNYHIGDLPDHRMRIHARRRGYELTHRCRQVTSDDFYNYDLIIAMDSSNEENLRRLSPDAESWEKIVPMASFVDKAMRHDYIPDPYYSGAEGFELVLDLLENGCRNLFTLLTGRPCKALL